VTDRRLADVAFVGYFYLTPMLLDVLFEQPLTIPVPWLAVDVVSIKPSTDRAVGHVTHLGDLGHRSSAFDVLLPEEVGIVILTAHRRSPLSTHPSAGIS
jgi:hypothetical protein